MKQSVKIMPCLDMQNGRVVKGVHFVDIRDAGDPVACARAHCAAGADELALLDITATVEWARTMLDVVRRVADVITVPFTVGGGIRDVATAEAVLKAGADKVSTSSAAFRNPEVIAEMVKEFGAERVTVALISTEPGASPGYEVYIDGGRTATGVDAIEWSRRVDGYGVGCIFANEQGGRRRQDGIRAVVDPGRWSPQSPRPLLPLRGAGELSHFLDAVEAGATILLAASVFHFGIITIPELKEYLKAHGVKVG